MEPEDILSRDKRLDFIISEEILDIQQGGYLGDLPKVLIVRQGNCSNFEAEHLEVGQIILIHEASTRKRVVASDIKQRYLSMGVNIPIEFQLLDNKNNEYERPASLRSLLEKHRLPFNAKFAQDDLQITVGHRRIDADKFGPISFECIYKERFLFGNIVCNGKLSPHAIRIPMYVKAKVSVVTGFNYPSSTREQARKSWEHFVQSLKRDAKKIGYNSSKLERAIIFFDTLDATKNTDNEPMYDVIRPSNYCTLMYDNDNSPVYLHLESESKRVTPITDKSAVQEERFPPSLSEVQKSTTHRWSEGTDCEKPPPLPERQRKPPKFRYCGTSDLQQSNREEKANSKEKNTSFAVAEDNDDVNKNVVGTLNVREHISRDDVSTGVSRRLNSEPTDSDKQYEPTTQLSHPAGDNREFTESREHHFSEDCPKQNRQHMISLKVKDVSEILRQLNLSEYAESFQNNLIDGELLSEFDEKILISEFGFTRIQAMRLQKFITTGHIPH